METVMNKITEIQVFGERNSGTNYLRKLFEKNYKNIKTLIGSDGFGWKHGNLGNPWIRRKDDGTFVHIPIRDYKKDSENVLFVIIYRNPLTWIQSTHQSPHHAPELFDLSFNDFITKRWRSYYGPGATDLDPDQEKRFSIINENNLFEEYENIFDLRKQKINIFEKFKDKVNNVTYLQYENLREDYSAVLKKIALEYDIETNSKTENIYEDKFGFEKYKKKKYPPVSSETLDTLFEEIDWRFENKIGYWKNGAFCRGNGEEEKYYDLEQLVDRTNTIRIYKIK
jgi:hypothetical protein